MNWKRLTMRAMGAAAFCIAAGGAMAAAPTLSWSNTFGGSATGGDNATDLTVDGSGNIYVLSDVDNGTVATPQYDVLLRKYGPTGALLWSATYDAVGDDEASIAVAVDGTGNVYVGLTAVYSASNFDGVVLKYNSAGVLQWTYREVPTIPDFDDYILDMAIGSNRVYFAMRYGDAAGVSYDGALIAIDANGARQWGKTFNGTGNGYDQMDNVGVLPNGNVVARGRVRNGTSTATGRNNLMVCCTPAGAQVWTDQYLSPGANNEWTDALGFTQDASGNTYVGTLTDTGAAQDYFTTVMKYTSAGVRSYVNTAPDVGFDSYPNGIAVDGSGNAFSVGYKVNLAVTGSEDLRVRKINSTGTTVWDVLWNGASSLTDVGFEGFIDGNGDFTVCGFTNVVSGVDRDGILLNFKGTDGSLNWSKQYNNGAANDWDLFGFVEQSSGGSIVTAGYSYITASDADALVQKYEFAPTDIVAAGYQVNYGVETTAPGVSNLQANDANTVQLCLNPDQEDPNPVQMEVSATNGNVNPSSLNFNLVCRAEANDREVYVEMFNFNVGDWVGSPSFPVTDSDALYTVAAPGTAGQFVNDGDGAMITRITGFLGAADSPTLPCWDFNYCYWN